MIERAIVAMKLVSLLTLVALGIATADQLRGASIESTRDKRVVRYLSASGNHDCCVCESSKGTKGTKGSKSGHTLKCVCDPHCPSKGKSKGKSKSKGKGSPKGPKGSPKGRSRKSTVAVFLYDGCS